MSISSDKYDVTFHTWSHLFLNIKVFDDQWSSIQLYCAPRTHALRRKNITCKLFSIGVDLILSVPLIEIKLAEFEIYLLTFTSLLYLTWIQKPLNTWPVMFPKDLNKTFFVWSSIEFCSDPFEYVYRFGCLFIHEGRKSYSEAKD